MLALNPGDDGRIVSTSRSRSCLIGTAYVLNRERDLARSSATSSVLENNVCNSECYKDSLKTDRSAGQAGCTEQIATTVSPKLKKYHHNTSMRRSSMVILA